MDAINGAPRVSAPCGRPTLLVVVDHPVDENDLDPIGFQGSMTAGMAYRAARDLPDATYSRWCSRTVWPESWSPFAI